MSTLWSTTSFLGRASPGFEDIFSTPVIFFMSSVPSTVWPKIVCRLSRWGAARAVEIALQARHLALLAGGYLQKALDLGRGLGERLFLLLVLAAGGEGEQTKKD
jgi:hypothetical protein